MRRSLSLKWPTAIWEASMEASSGGNVAVFIVNEVARRQEMRDFRGTSYAREASNKTPPNMSVSAK